ncbi:MAG TPA: DUF4432 family protein, partial [Blastocatellia bacterium]
YRCVSLENEKLRVSIVADKGADIYEFLYKPRDVDFLWRSWVGLRPWSHHLPTSPRPAGPHLDYYEGGWQELFPNCGPLSLHQGAEIGQHGEVAGLPWDFHILKDDVDEIEVQFDVRTVRTPFRLVRRVALRREESVLRLSEYVTNEGGQRVYFTWGHHPALGYPFLEEGCRIDLPQCLIAVPPEFAQVNSRLAPDQSEPWPIALGRDGTPVDLSAIPSPDAHCHDMLFLHGITDGWYAVTNQKQKLGFGLRYPADTFKVLWYWLVCRGAMDYPWWGATYNIALEPCATMPILSEAAKKNEALSLEPGQILESELLAVAYEGTDSVSRITETGQVIG